MHGLYKCTSKKRTRTIQGLLSTQKIMAHFDLLKHLQNQSRVCVCVCACPWFCLPFTLIPYYNHKKRTKISILLGL
jgi:hypothetical protein